MTQEQLKFKNWLTNLRQPGRPFSGNVRDIAKSDFNLTEDQTEEVLAEAGTQIFGRPGY